MSMVTKHTITQFSLGLCRGLSRFTDVFILRHKTWTFCPNNYQLLSIHHGNWPYIFNAGFYKRGSLLDFGYRCNWHCPIFSHGLGNDTSRYRWVPISYTHTSGARVMAIWFTISNFISLWLTFSMQNNWKMTILMWVPCLTASKGRKGARGCLLLHSSRQLRYMSFHACGCTNDTAITIGLLAITSFFPSANARIVYRFMWMGTSMTRHSWSACMTFSHFGLTCLIWRLVHLVSTTNFCNTCGCWSGLLLPSRNNVMARVICTFFSWNDSRNVGHPEVPFHLAAWAATFAGCRQGRTASLGLGAVPGPPITNITSLWQQYGASPEWRSSDVSGQPDHRYTSGLNMDCASFHSKGWPATLSYALPLDFTDHSDTNLQELASSDSEEMGAQMGMVGKYHAHVWLMF